MKIVVFGLGHVGLANAVLLAQNHSVIGIDIDKSRVNSVNIRKSPFLDKHIDTYLSTKNLNLSAITKLNSACKSADYFIIATPTDLDNNTHQLNTSSIELIQKEIREINTQAYIVIKSTVPIGFTDELKNSTEDERILFSPEFLREGMALWDNLYPSRIIVGTDTSNSSSLMAAKTFANLLQSNALKADVPILIMNSTEAESVKLFSNAYLAMRVSFFNEIDSFAEIKNLNTKNIIHAVGLDPRIGDHYNNPSFGYGGYCLPKDTEQLVTNFSSVPNSLIQAIVNSNLTRKKHILSQILRKAENFNKPNITIGIFRLATKPSSSNLKNSVIYDIVQQLNSNQFSILIYEPFLTEKTYMGYKVIDDLDTFKSKSDIIVANRLSPALRDVKDKVYSRDVFNRD